MFLYLLSGTKVLMYSATHVKRDAMTLQQPKPVRVGLVMHSMQVAGAEMLVAEAVRRLVEKITPTIFCLDAVGALGEQLQKEGVEIVCLRRRPGRDWRVAGRLAHELRVRAVEVVHAHQYTPFFYAALAKALLFPRAPRLIFTEHGRHFPDVASRLRRFANWAVLHHFADVVNACCASAPTASAAWTDSLLTGWK